MILIPRYHPLQTNGVRILAFSPRPIPTKIVTVVVAACLQFRMLGTRKRHPEHRLPHGLQRSKMTVHLFRRGPLRSVGVRSLIMWIGLFQGYVVFVYTMMKLVDKLTIVLEFCDALISAFYSSSPQTYRSSSPYYFWQSTQSWTFQEDSLSRKSCTNR